MAAARIDGTLSDPYLRGIHDADGSLISGTTNDDSGAGYNSQVTFTATATGTHYIAAGAYSGQGTYELEVTQVAEITPIADDFAASSETTGIVEVGGSATIGEIGSADDIDWFAVELEAGKTYQIDIGGVITGGGTLSRGHLAGVYNANGGSMGVYDPVVITQTHIFVNGQLVRIFAGEDSQAFFTPDDDGTYYVAASNGFATGLRYRHLHRTGNGNRG